MFLGSSQTEPSGLEFGCLSGNESIYPPENPQEKLMIAMVKMLGLDSQEIFGWEREVCEPQFSPRSSCLEFWKGEEWGMRKTCWSKRPPLYKIQGLAVLFQCHM